jgi:radical SAM superfamily enzyme YgiQ (UPF0313 family)
VRLTLVDNLLLPEHGEASNLDVHPHLGLMSLVAVAQGGGHETEVIDPKWLITRGELRYNAELYAGAAEIIHQRRPDAVGFTTLGCSFIFVLKVARYLKKIDPHIPILLGGPHATILHRILLERFDEFDVVVRNEAEETLLPVLSGLDGRRFDSTPGVSWRAGEKVASTPGAPIIEDLDTLPFAAYGHYPIEDLGLENIRIDAGRGCPFNCTFCSTASFFGRSYRLKSAQRLVSEMDDLNQRYGFTDFKLNHDLFTVNKKKVRAFCEAVQGRGYTWGVSARVDCVDEPLLQTMWDAGCRGIYFGIETGSKRMQKVSEKRLDLDLLDPCLDVTERLGMRTIVSFIDGYPEENREDQDDTLDVLGGCFRRNRELFSTQLHMLTPEPGTQLYSTYGHELQYDSYLTDFNASRLEPDDEGIIKANPDVFVTYHYYPTLLPRHRHIFVIDAYRMLRKAGHTVLTYAMGFYEGRFSGIVNHLWDWARNAGREHQTVDAKLVVDFFRDCYGAHHLTSLFQYALLTEHSRLLGPARTRAEADAVELDPHQAYQLGPGAFLFEDLHDCAALIRQIEAQGSDSPPLNDSDAGPRGHYLVVCRGSKDGEMDNYELDPASFAVTTLFRRPRSYAEVCTALSPYVGNGMPDTDFFKELVAVGALTPAESCLLQ